jgi:ABC-type transport system involved in multi-copper enzyme maturation permease subunit
MIPLVRKEIRSIGPAWLLALVLAILPVWLVSPDPSDLNVESVSLLVFGPFALGVIILGLTPFGQELSWGTFSVLLSQPVERRKVWSVKVLILATSVGCVFFALCLSSHLRIESILESMKHTVWRNAFDRPGHDPSFFLKFIAQAEQGAIQQTWLIGGLTALIGFAGGLWTTLLFRQVTAAFWATLLVPMGLTVVTGAACRNFPDSVATGAVALILTGYSVAGYLWARRFFVQVQDIQWTGGTVALPAWADLFHRGSPLKGVRKHQPLLALWQKEFQAQQINLLLGCVLLVLHLGAILIRRASPVYLAAHQTTAMTLEMVPLLWWAMPLLIGSVAVAEERKLGTFQSATCLPARRFSQFLVKLVATTAFGVFLGGILPVAIETMAPASTLRDPSTGIAVLGGIRSVVSVQLWGAFGLSLIAFYSSTLTGNALQAMGVGLLGAALVCLGIFAEQHAEFSNVVLWRGRLMGLIALPAITVFALGLSYRNYRQVFSSARTWWLNLWAIFGGLVAISLATTIIYHRVWEAWLPEEPLHRVNFSFLDKNPNSKIARNGLSKTPKLQAVGLQKAAVLPDGRLWLELNPIRFVTVRNRFEQVVGHLGGHTFTGFVQGSDWKDVAVAAAGCFALRTDGSLWDLSEADRNGVKLRRVGEDVDWKSLSAGSDHFSALKGAGTLWQWGWKENNIARGLPESSAFSPVQVEADNDWVAICDRWTMCAAVKSDRSVWKCDWRTRRPRKWLEGACTTPVSMALIERAVSMVCADGTLWIGGDLTNTVWERVLSPAAALRSSHEMVRWTTEGGWAQVGFLGWGKAMGLKADGSLWEWDLTQSLAPDGSWMVQQTRPSLFSDWISVCDDDNTFLALAQDGTLCVWGHADDPMYYDWQGLPDPRRLLSKSRIKARKVADLSQ